MILFHGFGQDSNAFDGFEIVFPDFTFYLVSLPFHGASSVKNPDIPMDSGQVLEIINSLMSLEKIDKFVLTGFSIGARMVYPIIELLPHQIQEIILIGPDGITTNFWFQIATANRLSRSIFYFLSRQSSRLEKLIRLAGKLKLITKKTEVFALAVVGNPEHFKRIYNTWCAMRTLRCHPEKIAEKLNLNLIETTIVIGRHDPILKKKDIKPLLGNLKKIHLTELDCGHQDLVRKFAETKTSLHIR